MIFSNINSSSTGSVEREPRRAAFQQCFCLNLELFFSLSSAGPSAIFLSTFIVLFRQKLTKWLSWFWLHFLCLDVIFHVVVVYCLFVLLLLLTPIWGYYNIGVSRMQYSPLGTFIHILKMKNACNNTIILCF